MSEGLTEINHRPTLSFVNHALLQNLVRDSVDMEIIDEI